MSFGKSRSAILCLFVISYCNVGWCGKIVYPWNATTAIVKAGESFDVWFDADAGQTVTNVTLRGPYHSETPVMGTPVTGSWVYDQTSGNSYNTRITVTVPSTANADRYDLVLDTTTGQEVSRSAVKVIRKYKANYKILHISDTHLRGAPHTLGYLDGLLEKRLTAIVDMANIIDPELVFHTGDNLYWSPDSATFQARVDHLFDGDDSLGFKGLYDMYAATFVVVGNHDFEQGSGESFSAPYDTKARFWNKYYGLQSYHFKYGNTRCMLVNTGWVDFDFDHQLEDHTSWLNGAGAGGKLKIAAAHKSSVGKMGAWGNRIDLGLYLIGHNHHLGDSNPYKLDNKFIMYYALSVQDYCEFNLFRVNDNTGRYTALGYKNTDSASDGYGRPTGSCRVLANNDQKNNADTSVWIRNLTLTYANSNDGSSLSNTATLVNKFDFALSDARVRFVMPKGVTYSVSKGTIEQQFEGDSVHVVDVRIDLSANSTTKVEIKPSGLSECVSGKGDNFHNEPATRLSPVMSMSNG